MASAHGAVRGLPWKGIETPKQTRSSQMRRAVDRRELALLFLVVSFGFCVGISGAAAHSRLVKSDPSARAVLEKVPKELKLWFNEGVEPAFAKVWIVPAQGAQIPLTSHGNDTNPRLLVVTLPDSLPAGPVVIGYHMLSVDGHTVDDKLNFTVKAP
jgi:methionine-rich copper-binding protein CopC